MLHALGPVPFVGGQPRLVTFADVEAELTELLEAFGHPRSRQQPRYPFWRLPTDGIWEVEGAERLLVGADGDPPIAQLRRCRGGFPPDQWQRLRDNPALVAELARTLLEAHFPPSFHDDILARVGLVDVAVITRTPRDPAFRLTVLRAYEYRCAVCGWDGAPDHSPVALEAAHVCWHAAGGPERADNGLALCSSASIISCASGVSLIDQPMSRRLGLRISARPRVPQQQSRGPPTPPVAASPQALSVTGGRSGHAVARAR